MGRPLFYVKTFCRYSKVCVDGEYVGFDRQLGLCKCRVDDLENICDKKCRRQQKNRIEHVCAREPYIQINPVQGSPVRIPQYNIGFHSIYFAVNCCPQ